VARRDGAGGRAGGHRSASRRSSRKRPGWTWLRSASKPGDSMVFVILKDYTPSPRCRRPGGRCRKKLDDIRPHAAGRRAGAVPQRRVRRRADQYLRADRGRFDLAALHRYADRIALDLKQVPDVKRVELFGVQDEKIYLEIAPHRLANLGITPRPDRRGLAEAEHCEPIRFHRYRNRHVQLRVSGGFDSVGRVRNTTCW